MLSLTDLRVPILSSPMAGGPSTPSLVHALASEGASGFLAAGYKAPDVIAGEVAALRAMGNVPFGVNLFVPAGDSTRTTDQQHAIQQYRKRLGEVCATLGCEVGMPDPTDTDGWDEKIALLLDLKVPMVSFMFGCPSASVISSFHDAGTMVTVTVTDEDETRVATERGVDALVVQGPAAGGHRGTHAVTKAADQRPLVDLLRAITNVTGLPLIAAGGISGAEHVRDAMAAGATAVQVGTLLLRTPESGANQQHKDALAAVTFDRTAVTRVFSGRIARVMENGIVRALDADVPAAYPEVLQMMRPMRQEVIARGDDDSMALFAGTGFRAAREQPAASVVRALWDEVTSR